MGHVRQPSHHLQYEAAWRNMSCLNKSSAFAVREQCGHTLKSALRHILSVDRRDNPVFPTEGSFFKLFQEFAGLGGDVGFFKNELETQINVPLLPSNPNMILQGTFHCGHIKRLNNGEGEEHVAHIQLTFILKMSAVCLHLGKSTAVFLHF